MSNLNMKDVVVLGAGVIGLTTALKIQETGKYHVTIIAEVFPTDDKSIKYTSCWAGAHHVSGSAISQVASNISVNAKEMAQETFKTMWELSAPGQETEHCFLRIPQIEYYDSEKLPTVGLEHMPNYSSHPPLISGALSGESFDTVTIDVPVYLKFLLSKFQEKGGKIVRGQIQHINQVVEGGANAFLPKEPKHSPDAVIVCTGLGARSLGGVEDMSVYPVRGQTVLLKAPWIRFGRTFSNAATKEWTYIIPRRSGDVIVGGTMVPNDWHPTPRAETTDDILKRVIHIWPELASMNQTVGTVTPTVDEIRPLIIEEGCGLRPYRKGGIRLESDVTQTSEGKKVPLIFNYGHGGAGYIYSFGSASVALKLLEESILNLASK